MLLQKPDALVWKGPFASDCRTGLRFKNRKSPGGWEFEVTLKNLRDQFQGRSLLWILQRSLQRNVMQFQFTSLWCRGGRALPKTVLVRTLMPQSHGRIPLLTLYIAMIGVQRTGWVYCYWNTFNWLIWLPSIRNVLFNTMNDFNCGLLKWWLVFRKYHSRDELVSRMLLKNEFQENSAWILFLNSRLKIIKTVWIKIII